MLLLSAAILFVLNVLTNSLDTHKNAWDFVYYIAMAKDGFHAAPMASPFAYRYLTPLLVHGLSLLGVSIEHGFTFIAYFGALAQLTGIFFFVKWLTQSSKGAYLAMGVTALSLFNVKFLLFDVYRPDHLAYGLILLQTYFAFTKKFWLLLVTTIIASQIREFNFIPLIAYLFMAMRTENRNVFIKQVLLSAFCILPAILLPRLLIPVTADFQIIGFSQDKLINTLVLPFIPSVDVNFIFSIAAYFLPLLFLVDLKIIKSTFTSLPEDQRRYLLAYTVLVLLISFFGGTDFTRFATFLFLPQIILIGTIAPSLPTLRIGLMFASIFIFNRLWMHIPDWDVEKYRNFYGGFSLQLNMSTVYRITEWFGFLLLGLFLRKGNQLSNASKTETHT